LVLESCQPGSRREPHPPDFLNGAPKLCPRRKARGSIIVQGGADPSLGTWGGFGRFDPLAMLPGNDRNLRGADGRSRRKAAVRDDGPENNRGQSETNSPA